MAAPPAEDVVAEQTLVEVVFSHPSSIGMRFAERVSDEESGGRWLVVESIAGGTQAAMVPQLHSGMVVHSVGDKFIDQISSQHAIEMMKQRPGETLPRSTFSCHGTMALQPRTYAGLVSFL